MVDSIATGKLIHSASTPSQVAQPDRHAQPDRVKETNRITSGQTT